MLSLLKETGADKDTIIILWGDHGWHLGEQQIWGKHSPYAVAYHSPLCIKLPETIKAGVPSDEVVESVDIYPTLCDLVKIEKPAHLKGNSLIDLLDNPTAKSDGIALCYWANLQSTITAGENKIIDRKTNKLLQHYNLETDPHETTNLVTAD
jgi:iduronate 2-sulfatase